MKKNFFENIDFEACKIIRSLHNIESMEPCQNPRCDVTAVESGFWDWRTILRLKFSFYRKGPESLDCPALNFNQNGINNGSGVREISVERE